MGVLFFFFLCMIAFNGIDTVGYNDHVLGEEKRKEKKKNRTLELVLHSLYILINTQNFFSIKSNYT